MIIGHGTHEALQHIKKILRRSHQTDHRRWAAIHSSHWSGDPSLIWNVVINKHRTSKCGVWTRQNLSFLQVENIGGPPETQNWDCPTISLCIWLYIGRQVTWPDKYQREVPLKVWYSMYCAILCCLWLYKQIHSHSTVIFKRTKLSKLNFFLS